MQTVTFSAADVDQPPPVAGPITFTAADIQRPDFTTTNEPPSPGLWEQANTSPFHKEIHGAAEAIANFLSEPHLNEAQLNEKVPGLGTAHAMLRGGVAGLVEGAGNLAENFTTPIGIAMTLAGLGGETKLVQQVPGLARVLTLPAVRRLRQVVQFGTGAAFAAHGAQDVITAPTLGGKAQGVVEMATGTLGMAGPLAEARAGWAQYRQTANGVKSATAFKQAAPPSKATPYTDEQFHRAMPALEVEHAQTPIGSLADALAAADTQIGIIEQYVAGAVRQFPEATIRTNPLQAARHVLASSVRADALNAGMAELKSLNLDQPLTLERADAIRLQLNAENKGILRRNRYDVATARAVDPGFAAREAAARALREGIYTELDAQGFRGIRQLRQDEGAIIAVRNAIDRQIFNGEKTVAGSSPAGLVRKTAAVGVRLTPLPAVITDPVARALAPANRTRDALMARAFGLRRPVFGSVAAGGRGTVPPPDSTTPGGTPPPAGPGPSGLPPGTSPSAPPPAGIPSYIQQLLKVGTSKGGLPTGPPDASGVRSVSAAPLTYEFTQQKRGGRHTLGPASYSGDPSASAAPQLEIDPLTAYALKWIRQDLDQIPFTPRSVVDAGPGRGGDRVSVGGAAGAHIYREIVGAEGQQVVSASRAEVIQAIDNLLKGKLTKVGELALGVAKSVANASEENLRRRLMTGPPPLDK